MKHMIKTKAQLLNEVARLRKRIKKNGAASNKRAKTVLLPFTELYNLLFNSVNDEIFVYEYHNQEGVPSKFLEVNGVACKQLGYTREELLKKGPYDIHAPETIPHVEVMMKKLMTQKYTIWEGIHLAKNGHRIPVEVSNHLFELKGKPTVISAVKDITSRKKAEEAQKQIEQAVHESEHRFRTLAEASFEGIALTENGIIVDMNDQLAHMYEYKRSELIGKSLLDIVVPELRAHVNGAIQLDIRESYEILGLRKNDTTFPAEIRGRITRMGGKELHIFTIRDITERKQTEETFQHERNILRTLIDNLPDAVYVKDTKCCKTVANLADVHNMGGQSEAEVLGKNDYDFYPADIAAAFYADDQSVIQTGQPVLNKEEFLIDKEGKGHWLLTSKLPLRDEQGQITGLVGVGREITEQKHIEEALKHEKSLLDALMDNIPDSIYFKDRQCRHIRMNRKEMRDLNVDDMSQIVGKTDIDLWGEEHGRKSIEIEQRMMESGEPIIGLIESRQLEDGQTIWTWTTKVPMRDDSGQIVGLVGISREISDLMRAQEERERERTLLRTLIDNLPDYIYIKDTKGRYIVGNIAVVHKFGFSSEDKLIGKTDFDLFPHDLALQYYAYEQEIIQSGKGLYDYEGPAVDASKEEKERWVSTTKVPLRDVEGKVIGTVGIDRDITERKRMEETLRETADKFRFVFENAYDGLSVFEETSNRKHRRLIDCNKRYAEMAGRSREELLQIGTTMDIAKSLSDDHHESNVHDVVFGGSYSWIRPDGKDNVIEYTAVPFKMQGKIMTIGIDRDITERKRIEEEREQLIKKLQAALSEVKTLSGLVPICANCKQIRDDKGFWMQVESYIQERSHARFSHGICPDCMKKLYPEFLQKEDE